MEEMEQIKAKLKEDYLRAYQFVNSAEFVTEYDGNDFDYYLDFIYEQILIAKAEEKIRRLEN